MVSLAQAKAHCRVDHDDDDAVITAMIAAASDHLTSIGVATDADPSHPAVDHAIMMLVAHFYENREAVEQVATVAVALGVDRLVQPYREISL